MPRRIIGVGHGTLDTAFPRYGAATLSFGAWTAAGAGVVESTAIVGASAITLPGVSVSGTGTTPADYTSAAITSGDRYWEADTATTKQTHLGWGCLSQIGQEEIGLSSDPEWADEAATALAELSITYIGLNAWPGLMHSDSDYWLTWFNAGMNIPSAEWTGVTSHRFYPIASANYFSREDFYLAFVAKFRTAVLAEGNTFNWYLKVSQSDSGTGPTGYYVLSANPSNYAAIMLAFWNHIAANWSTLGQPAALDLLNEAGFGNTWDDAASEQKAALEATRTALLGAAYSEPEWWGPSSVRPNYQAATWEATALDNLYTSTGGANVRLTSHMYFAPSYTHSTIRSEIDAMATKSASRGGGWLDTEGVWKPLMYVTMMARGRCQGSMNFAAGWIAGDGEPANALLTVDPSASVGSQITHRPNVAGNRLLFETFRPGDTHITATKNNLVDADNAECAMCLDSVTGFVKGVAVTNTGNPIWVAVPAGRYRVKKCLMSYADPLSHTGDPTVTSSDLVGVTYDVAAGEGIWLNEHDSNAAGVFSFVQESEPDGAIFTDDFETGDTTHTEGGVSWTWPNLAVEAGMGVGGSYALDLTVDQTDPTLGGPQGSAERPLTGFSSPLIAVDMQIKVSSNFVHPKRIGGPSWTNCAINASSTTLVRGTGTFTAVDIGRPMRVPGAGVAGGNLDAWVMEVLSSTTVRLSVAASTTVSGVTVATISKSHNNKLMALWGGTYAPPDRPFALFEFIPDNIPDERHGDARIRILHSVAGGGSQNVGTNGSTADTLPVKYIWGADAIAKGEYGRLRFLVYTGEAEGPVGHIKFWVNDTLAYSTETANIFTPTGPANFDRLYLLGAISSGYYDTTQFSIDNVKLYTSDPGW